MKLASPRPLWAERFKLEQKTRLFFYAHDFIETPTPLLVKSPGLEPHIKPIEVKRSEDRSSFLPTSPEFAMKKLLAKGLGKIFQIAPAFRDEPDSPDHSPEFRMLEFYETNVSLEALQKRVEDLMEHLCRETHSSLKLNFRGVEVEIRAPFLRFRVVDLFQTHVGIDLRTHSSAASLAQVCAEHSILADENESWDDLYFKLWLNLIEPKLPKNRLSFVTHYPVSQSSLCNRVADETGFVWANRFELYLGNFELGNAFDELRDAEKQRKNFEHDQKVRKMIYQDRYPTSPIDEDFLKAIAEMPPTCGIAIGMDRLAMLILEAEHIRDVIPLPSFW